jgi:hypothetical protein
MHIQRKYLATAVLSITAVMFAAPLFAFSAFATANTYSFSASPATYNTTTGDWVINPGTGTVTYTGSTNDLAATQITLSGACTGVCSGGSTFIASCNTSPPVTTCTTTPGVKYIAGDTWDLVVTFYHGVTPVKIVKAAIFPTVVVAPEFPYGAALAIVAPIAALGLFIVGKKRSQLPF